MWIPVRWVRNEMWTPNSAALREWIPIEWEWWDRA